MRAMARRNTWKPYANWDSRPFTARASILRRSRRSYCNSDHFSDGDDSRRARAEPRVPELEQVYLSAFEIFDEFHFAVGKAAFGPDEHGHVLRGFRRGITPADVAQD